MAKYDNTSNILGLTWYKNVFLISHCLNNYFWQRTCLSIINNQFCLYFSIRYFLFRNEFCASTIVKLKQLLLLIYLLPIKNQKVHPLKSWKQINISIYVNNTTRYQGHCNIKAIDFLSLVWCSINEQSFFLEQSFSISAIILHHHFAL